MAAPAERGPFPATALGTRLTFNRGEDRDPSVLGDIVVFSRREPAARDDDRCVAWMPAEGGTLTNRVCPRGLLIPNDTTDAWRHPALSPSGAWLAFVEQASGRRVGSVLLPPLNPDRRQLMLAPAENPVGRRLLLDLPAVLPNGARMLDLRDLVWRGEDTVRFLAGADSYRRVGGHADTAFAGFAVVDLAVTSGALQLVVPASAYVSVPGGMWYLNVSELRFRSDDALTDSLVADLPGLAAVRGLGVYQGRPVFATFSAVHLVRPDGATSVIWSADEITGVASNPAGTFTIISARTAAGDNMWRLNP